MPPVFVGGTGRSGTTITANLLGQHSALATIPAELWIHVRPNGLCELAESRGNLSRFLRWVRGSGYRRRSRWLRPEGPWIGLFELIDRPTFDTVVDRFEESYADHPHAAVVSLMTGIIDTAMADHQGRAWIEHSPANVLHISTLSRLFPDALFLHVLRDGRDVAHSVQRVPWGPSDFEEAVRWWARVLRRAHRQMQSAPRGSVHVVRLEDLLGDRSEETLATLMEFLGLGLESEPGFERFARGRSNPSGEAVGLTARRAHAGHWRQGIPRDQWASVANLYAGVLASLRQDGVTMPSQDGVERLDGPQASHACHVQECYELWAEVEDQEASLRELADGAPDEHRYQELIDESRRLRRSSDAWRGSGASDVGGAISRLKAQRTRLAEATSDARRSGAGQAHSDLAGRWAGRS